MDRDQDQPALLHTAAGAARGASLATHATRNTSVILTLLSLLGVFPLVQSRLVWEALAGVAFGLTCASMRWGEKPGMHLGALTCLLLGTLALFGSMKFWPIAPIIASIVYVVCAKRVPVFGGLPPWFERGRLDGSIWLSIGASTLISSTALVLWFVLLKPDYGDVLRTIFPKLPVYLLFTGIVVFAMLNAALEEFMYRGVVMGSLDATLGAGMGSVLLQAGVFGIVHIGGFPRGAIGVVLATIYGLMMGAVRRRSAGMLAPWIAHVCTDVAIGLILLSTLLVLPLAQAPDSGHEFDSRPISSPEQLQRRVAHDVSGRAAALWAPIRRLYGGVDDGRLGPFPEAIPVLRGTASAPRLAIGGGLATRGLRRSSRR